MKGVKRSLQTTCPVFSKTGSGGANNLVNWTGTDSGSSITLSAYCATNNCCTGPNACGSNWNTAATYTVCPNSCQGSNSCRGIAQSAASGSTIEIEEGACVGISSCENIKGDSSVLANVLVEASQCVTDNACENCGSDSAFTGVFNANQNCCDAVEMESNGNLVDIACHDNISGKKMKE